MLRRFALGALAALPLAGCIESAAPIPHRRAAAGGLVIRLADEPEAKRQRPKR